MDELSFPEEIKSFFKEIIEKLKKELDPEYILIAGSFAKEGWIYLNKLLLSDFEFVFIKNHTWSRAKKKYILNQLNSEYPFKINLKGYLLKNVQRKIISNYSFKYFGYVDLPFFDTFYQPQILYSKKLKSHQLPKLNSVEIPFWEAWRLFANRIGEILAVVVNHSNFNETEINYYWLKCFESLGDCYLLLNNKYDKNIARKIFLLSKYLENDETIESYTISRSSFEIIKLSLKARLSHNLSEFKIDQSFGERIDIINNWMNYIEDKMYESEGLINEEDSKYYKNYLQSKNLQNKYLETNYGLNISISNLIRLLNNPFLRNKIFKFYNFKYSWRHLILLIIVSTFKELQLHNNFEQSKSLFSLINKRKYLNDSDGKTFVQEVLKYWEILR